MLALASAEAKVRYHSLYIAFLTPIVGEQCQLGSLPGAGAS